VGDSSCGIARRNSQPAERRTSPRNLLARSSPALISRECAVAVLIEQVEDAMVDRSKDDQFAFDDALVELEELQLDKRRRGRGEQGERDEQ
jgi:hypothetical protein